MLGDGRIVLIMNPVQLAQRQRAAPAAARTLFTTTSLLGDTRGSLRDSTSIRAARAPVVMVVDDSLTVRKITSRLLEREGYRVLTAKDGVDALEQMARHRCPRVMLVDIEMPRMDGFDLARNVRADARTQGVPIIIISSRTAEKHRNQAAAARRQRVPRQALPGGRAAAAGRQVHRVKVEGPQAQQTIGKYPVIREIGSGATSRVYLARDPFAEREVAIKVLQFARRRRSARPSA